MMEIPNSELQIQPLVQPGQVQPAAVEQVPPLVQVPDGMAAPDLTPQPGVAEPSPSPPAPAVPADLSQLQAVFAPAVPVPPVAPVAPVPAPVPAVVPQAASAYQLSVEEFEGMATAEGAQKALARVQAESAELARAQILQELPGLIQPIVRDAVGFQAYVGKLVEANPGLANDIPGLTMASVLAADRNPQLDRYQAINEGAKQLLAVKSGAAPANGMPVGVAPAPQGVVPQQVAPTGQAKFLAAMLDVAKQEKEGSL